MQTYVIENNYEALCYEQRNQGTSTLSDVKLSQIVHGDYSIMVSYTQQFPT